MVSATRLSLESKHTSDHPGVGDGNTGGTALLLSLELMQIFTDAHNNQDQTPQDEASSKQQVHLLEYDIQIRISTHAIVYS